MSPDEADMDLGLQDKLVATEVEKFNILYEGVEDNQSLMLLNHRQTWLDIGE